jgi:hypothetical protein
MSRLRLALVLLLLLVGASAYMRPSGPLSARAAAPVMQATASTVAAPTPVVATTPQAAAPIGEGTQQVLLVLGFVVLTGALIAGGIYLRRRWIATRY